MIRDAGAAIRKMSQGRARGEQNVEKFFFTPRVSLERDVLNTNTHLPASVMQVYTSSYWVVHLELECTCTTIYKHEVVGCYSYCHIFNLGARSARAPNSM